MGGGGCLPPPSKKLKKKDKVCHVEIADTFFRQLAYSDSSSKFRKYICPSEFQSHMNNTFNLQITFPSFAATSQVTF